jgi:hypothetical protein
VPTASRAASPSITGDGVGSCPVRESVATETSQAG